MGHRERQQRYDDYIERASQAATAAWRRVPYHLEYLRRHGSPPAPAGNLDSEKERGA